MTGEAKLNVETLSAWYGSQSALHEVSLKIPPLRVTALIGPSGCGKSTFLRCLNRLHEEVPGARMTGTIELDGEDLRAMDPVAVRFRLGMVFQRPVPFPNLSIYDNVATGLRLLGVRRREELDDGVVEALSLAGLWEEVEERLDDPGTSLSGGQQQRLCIARALAVRPEVLLLDEPCAALDPIATLKIEKLILQLRDRYTLLVATHNLPQAIRISDHTAFFYLGRLVETGETPRIFENPEETLTQNYVAGRFG